MLELMMRATIISLGLQYKRSWKYISRTQLSYNVEWILYQVICYVVSICQSKGMQTVFDFFGHLLFHWCFLEARVTLFTMRSIFFSCCWCYEVQIFYSYLSSRSSTDYLQVLNPKISCLIMSALNILGHIIPFYCMQTLQPKQ